MDAAGIERVEAYHNSQTGCGLWKVANRWGPSASPLVGPDPQGSGSSLTGATAVSKPGLAHTSLASGGKLRHQTRRNGGEALRMRRDFRFFTCYLNLRRLIDLLGADPVTTALRSVPELMNPKLTQSARLAACAELLRKWLLQNWKRIPPLDQLLLKDRAKPGRLFTTYRDFYCRNLSASIARRGIRPMISAKYRLGERTIELQLKPHRDHLAPGSPGETLSGHVASVFVVGAINSLRGEKLVASPIFAGLLTDPQDEFFGRSNRDGFIPVEEIDNFKKCREEAFPSSSELQILKGIPESEIKRAFASLLKERNIPKDWGGEVSDLYTDKLRIDGRRVTAAFLFKGPARFHEMRLTDLGKRGNQIDRLFREPASLLVLQHCHYIHSDVRNMMMAYANQIGKMREFSVIDGSDTLRVLRAYRKCGQKPHPAPSKRRVQLLNEDFEDF